MKILMFGATGMPFKAACRLRLWVIQPPEAVRSKTALYRAAHVLSTPLIGLLRRLAPTARVTSAEVERAMPAVARGGYPRPVLELADIQAAARG